MDVTTGFLAVLGGLLVFLLPGYTLTKALFPDWRIRGPDAGLRAVEIVALSLVTSVALTVVVGFALLVLPGAGFAASWNDPMLEGVLAGIATLGLGVGVVRGAYGREPPPSPAPEPSPGSDDGWALVGRLEAIDRERRRLLHELRRGGLTGPEADRRRKSLEALDREADEVRRRREGEYGS